MGQLIVLSNLKGGVGNSTLAIHLAIALYYEGYTVSIYDGDNVLKTVKRFFENRKVKPFLLTDSWRQDLQRVDFVILDMPSSGVFDQMLCSQASYLITPISDSLADLDQFICKDPDGKLILGRVTESIFKSRLQRAKNAQKVSFRWMIIRNRLHYICARNSPMMITLLNELNKRANCIWLNGLSERVIFHELFDCGLTLLDQDHRSLSTLAHVSARQEVRNLMYKVVYG